MITRAQAEALLTLAESLEACQKLDVHLTVPGRGEMSLCYGPCEENLDLSGDELSPFYLRLAVKALTPFRDQEIPPAERP
jgi:hypothetical protein